MARVLGIDPGGKRVGIAVSDPTGTVAQPLNWIAAEPEVTLVERLTRLAREQEAAELVVGLPWRLDGSQGPEARAARRLASRLREASGLPVTLVDERLTSVAAERALIAAGERRERRRQLSDQVAAALLLQGHLDSVRARRGRA
jgi:putative Holliday junction resolvase